MHEKVQAKAQGVRLMLRANDPASSMTVREYVAVEVMAAMIASGKFAGNSPGHVAGCAVNYADALIARLNGATATPSRIMEDDR
jgi:hypothetical protein